MIYMVADARSTLDNDIVNTFSVQDRAQIGPGIWVVRSPRITAAEVVEDLGIGEGKAALVVQVQRYGGFTRSEVVDKLHVWSSS